MVLNRDRPRRCPVRRPRSSRFAGSVLRASVQYVKPLSVDDAACRGSRARSGEQRCLPFESRRSRWGPTVDGDLLTEIVDDGHGIGADAAGRGPANLAQRACEAGKTYGVRAALGRGAF